MTHVRAKAKHQLNGRRTLDRGEVSRLVVGRAWRKWNECAADELRRVRDDVMVGHHESDRWTAR
jgi:hypothetical protein